MDEFILVGPIDVFGQGIVIGFTDAPVEAVIQFG